MSYFATLGILPTDDKMAIRRAYVKRVKEVHPDQGGDAIKLAKVEEAYKALVKRKTAIEIVSFDYPITMAEMVNGCIASAMVNVEGSVHIVEFTIPPFTYPNSYIEFTDKNLTSSRFRVKILENDDPDYIRVDTVVIAKVDITQEEAIYGKSITVINFDGKSYSINIPPGTTANKLMYYIDGAGFFKKDTTERDHLTIVVTVQKEGS